MEGGLIISIRYKALSSPIQTLCLTDHPTSKRIVSRGKGDRRQLPQRLEQCGPLSGRLDHPAAEEVNATAIRATGGYAAGQHTPELQSRQHGR